MTWNPFDGLSTVNVGWQKLHEDAILPTYGSEEAAGADLYAIEDGFLLPGERKLFKTGIALQMPPGFWAEIRGRSGLALKHGITTLGGCIDSDYRGDVGVILHNTNVNLIRPTIGLQPGSLVVQGASFHVKKGDRIAQILFHPIMRAQFHAVGGVLSETKRGTGGYGSTGGFTGSQVDASNPMMGKSAIVDKLSFSDAGKLQSGAPSPEDGRR